MTVHPATPTCRRCGAKHSGNPCNRCGANPKKPASKKDRARDRARARSQRTAPVRRKHGKNV